MSNVTEATRAFCYSSRKLLFCISRTSSRDKFSLNTCEHIDKVCQGHGYTRKLKYTFIINVYPFGVYSLKILKCSVINKHKCPFICIELVSHNKYPFFSILSQGFSDFHIHLTLFFLQVTYISNNFFLKISKRSVFKSFKEI